MDEDEGLSYPIICAMIHLFLFLIRFKIKLGRCLRSAEGAGVNLVILPSDRSAGLTRSRHVAAGAAESIPLMRSKIWLAHCTIKEHGIFLLGTSDQAKYSLYDVDFLGQLP